MREQQTKSALRNKAALYIRLSKEDAGDRESASIGTQRELLTKYAKEHELIIVDEYVDDGYSGTNFDRPAYKRMIADIENGRVNCVLTKDSSRLGRSSSKTLELLDEYFPLRDVRYIAINDGYDNENLSNGAAVAMPFMAVVNECYARDISAKIRSSLYTKMENGEYVASFAPYGYKKDVENKNRLIIDTAVAPIVQGIFRAAAEGQRPSEIAEGLNNRGIATPAEYRCQCRPYLSIDDYSKRKEWTAVGICKMLRNEVYLGKTLQGKTQKVSFKSKMTRTAPHDQWYIKEGTHEPIIDEDIFRMARDRCVARRSPATKGFENIFSGIARCADCGHAMSTTTSRKKGATCNLICGSYKAHGAGECGNHVIDYDFLYETVRQELRTLISLAPAERSTIVDELLAIAREQREHSSEKQTLGQMQREVEKLTLNMKRLYEDFATNRITRTMYESIAPQYEADMSSLKYNISQIEETVKSCPQEEQAEAYEKFFALLDDVIEVKDLSRPLLYSLIDRIEVEQGRYVYGEDGKKHKQQTVRIYYRFIGQFLENK